MASGGTFGQQPTPMGGGQSPLSTGGGFSGGFGGGQTVGTMGGFGGNLGTAGMGGQQNSGSLLMRPENPIPYTGPTDPSQILNKFSTGLGDWFARQQQPPPAPNQVAQPVPLQNPFQPEEPSYMKDPEYQGYETQARDLSRQMDEYMKKAPMYQQLQELQGKMSPFQQREMQRRQLMQQNPMGGAQYGPYEQQRDQQAYQQQQLQRQQLMQQMQQRQQPFNPYARQMPQQRFNPYQQQQNPYSMSMDRPQPYQRNQGLAGLLAAFPQNFGREQRYSNPADFANYNVMRPALAATPAPAPAAVEASPAVFDPGYQVASW